MKYKLINLCRSLGLLRLMDAVLYLKKGLKSWPLNRAFVKRNPGFATPPPDLAFDALHHADWNIYKLSGEMHAKVFARIINERIHSDGLKVLEWGSGPGRVIRHMPGLLDSRNALVTGTDYNERSVDWCRENLPGISFVKNALEPPVPFDDGTFDVVYNFSVFTHLSESIQLMWAKELHRLLKPGGLMISTTQGDHYRYLLTSEQDRKLFDSGKVVVQSGYKEGMKWFFAIQPDIFVRNSLFRDFHDVEKVPTKEEDWFMQDVWVGWKK